MLTIVHTKLAWPVISWKLCLMPALRYVCRYMYVRTAIIKSNNLHVLYHTSSWILVCSPGSVSLLTADFSCSSSKYHLWNEYYWLYLCLVLWWSEKLLFVMFSIFSSSNISWSAASPCSTIVLSNDSDRYFERSGLRSIIFTWYLSLI